MRDWTRRQAGKPWPAGGFTAPDLAHAVIRRSEIHSLSLSIWLVCALSALGIRFVGNHVPRGLTGNFYNTQESTLKQEFCETGARCPDPKRTGRPCGRKPYTSAVGCQTVKPENCK